MYPQVNAARSILDLGGIWDFQLEEGERWQSIAVPASYNDQKADIRFRSHVGPVRYRTRIILPRSMQGQRRVLRFDAVTHDARVFLDGKLICTHKGGFLPFEKDITDILPCGQAAVLEVVCDNTINHSSLPVGNESGVAFFGSDNAGVPTVEAGKRRQAEKGINLPNFDFFNYAGINRPVRIYTTPAEHIEDIVLVPSLDGRVRFRVTCTGQHEPRLTVYDREGTAVARAAGFEGVLVIPAPHLWEPAPGDPYLYTVRVECGEDQYERTLGIRSVRVDGHTFLINEKPFYFKGPCKHEDSFFHGRGLDQCLNVTDIGLYHWLNANAFRTSHYPYAEEIYDLCDREGIVIIDETPAVGIGAGPDTDPYETFGLKDYHAAVLRDMIARDARHPSVVMWSLGNEPDTCSFPQSAYRYWHALYELAHCLDPEDRPVTMVGCQNDFTKDITTPSMDVVCINRYYGWYNLSGDLETAAWAFREELKFWKKVDRPLILTEYGADTVSGLHGAAPEMFTEEFQAAYYRAINACLDECDFVTGELPWNFADFSTLQGPMRAGGNRKGLFTRDRRPKMAAHYLKDRWSAPGRP